MKMKGKQKIITVISIAVMAILIIIAGVYSANNNFYALDVVTDIASSEDGNLRITEEILPLDPTASVKEYDAEELNYKVKVQNVLGTDGNNLNREVQVAMVLDTSYSMDSNDYQSILKETAINLANGIFDNVDGVRISLFSNSGRRVSLTSSSDPLTTNKTKIVDGISNITMGETEDCNYGLEQAHSSGFGNPVSGKTANRVIIYITDSTDNVSEKMAQIQEQDSSLEIINILVDMTSSGYLNLATGEPVGARQTVYVIPSNVNESSIIPENINIYSEEKIYEELNLAANSIKVANTFSDQILEYFEIEDLEDTQNGVTETKDATGKIIGYEWNIGTLRFAESKEMTFKVKLNTNKTVAAADLFQEVYTNKEQNVTYNIYNANQTVALQGTDERISDTAGSTAIKICKGYNLKIKAVNDSNSGLVVEGVEIRVVGINEETGETVCDLTKTTDAHGYITVTSDDTKALRRDGQIFFTLTATNSAEITGYTQSKTLEFPIVNDAYTTTLDMPEPYESDIEPDPNINERSRLVEVEMPIASLKTDFEIIAQELNDNSVTLSDCEFELIQPKLNSKYEMNVLSGKTDENGVLHLNPTVMTKDGTYNYILRQVSAPSTHDVTAITLIKITFENGRIVAANEETGEITTMYNENVTAVLASDSKTSDNDHVIVTVGDICVAQDPFPLQINLSDLKDNNIKLEGVTYLVEVTNSLGEVRREYANTDENGQIKLDVFGTGNLKLKITEDAPKVGYKRVSTPKEIILNRSNGSIWILNTYPADISNTPEYNTSFIVDDDGNPIGLNVNLASEKKEEQNIIAVKLVYADEQDTPVGPGIVYDLYDDEGNNYGPAVSNKNGELSFTIGNESEGTHTYHLVPDLNFTPSEFDTELIDSNIDIQIDFDSTGYIKDGGSNLITSGPASLISEGFRRATEDEKINYTYGCTLGYYLQLGNTFNFKVKLTDQESNAGIEGAKYNVDVTWTIIDNGNVITRTKTITGRATDTNGELSTVLVKADDMTINVTEIEPRVGYNLDSTTQEIHLTKNNNSMMVIDAQTPYDLGQTNTKKPNLGAEIDDEITQTLLYKHQNKARTVDDTYINLTVHKIDMNGTSVNGKLVKVSSAKLVDENEEELETVIATGSQNIASVGEIVYDYNDYANGVENSHTIRVPNLKELVHEDDQLTMEVEITEVGQDPLDQSQYIEKEETKVKLRLTFKNKGGMIRLTDCQPIYGMRLFADEPHFSSGADTTQGKEEQDALGIYFENITLELYTDYDDFGNLSFDFKKQSVEGMELSGAKYDIRVVNPDGTQYNYQNITVKNGNTSEDIELKGVTVYKDSLIYIQETEAPIGFAVNGNVETLLVTDVSNIGDITFEHINNSYDPERIEIIEQDDISTSIGTIKKNYQVNLIDQQLDTFKIKANTVDAETSEAVEGFEFKVNTSAGAYGILESGEFNQIGGNPINTTVTYTLTETKTADYYRKQAAPIKAVVVFDGAGSVDVAATLDAQTDPNYGTEWTISNISATEEGELILDIKVSHLDPLEVKVNTYDVITNAKVSNVDYQVTPSEVLPATGYDSISVGYVIENGMIAYTLTQTNTSENYAKPSDINFSLKYVDAKVDSVSGVTFDSSAEIPHTVEKTGDKEITISVYVQPKVPFEILNKEFFGNHEPLQGANFEVTEVAKQETSTTQTGADGKAVTYNSIFEANTSKMYLVRQTLAKTGYATVEDFYIKVDYSDDKTITAATLVDRYGQEVTDNRFVTVGYRIGNTTEYNKNQKGIVTLDVKNYPEFRFNITNVDRRDSTTPIEGTQYSVSSTYVNSDNQIIDFISTDNVLTNDAGLGIAHLDKTKENTIVTYKITEDVPAIGYQSLAKEVEIRVTFDENGYVTNAELVDEQIANIANVSIVNPINTDVDRFTVNVTLKNNPILKINLITTDRTDNTIRLRDVGYEIVSTIDETVYSNSSNVNRVNQTDKPDTSYSDNDGLSISYMDRTVENSIMTYTIKEVKKAVGYDWLNEDIKLKVTYASDGKISVVPTIEQGNTDCNIISWDAENFEINMYVYNDEVKEFGIHLTVSDIHDKDKKIDNMKVDAYLTDLHDISNSIPDSNGKYEFRAVNEDTDGINATNGALLTGADRNGDGLPDLAHGEDYKVMGQYETTDSAATEVRYLRLRIDNDASEGAGSVNGYYLDSYGTNDGESVGHYKGSQFHPDAKYQNVIYNWIIKLTFNDEGKVIAAEPQSGLLANWGGWFVDDRYIEVGQVPENGTYKLDVRMKLYPMLEINVLGMDNYTEEDLTGSQYLISTKRYSLGGMETDEFVKAGYIGFGEGGLRNGGLYPGHAYENYNTMYMPISIEEDGNERLIYVYENQEPTNYQQHRPRYLIHYHERLVAILKVKFNDLGEIIYQESINRYETEDTGNIIAIEPYWKENVKSTETKVDYNLLAADNIKKYNYKNTTYEYSTNRDIHFHIGCGLTTKINVTAIDDISSDPITNIKMLPLINNEEISQIPEANEMHLADTFYEYTTTSYKMTANNGKSSWIYWGAAENTDTNKYIIGSSRTGGDYNGYLFPKDMALDSLGGSGNEKDYYVKLDVTYDDNGRISDVTSIGSDLWGDNNVSDITWDSETGTININMLYSRKLQTSIYKTDYYDPTINDLYASFDVRSNKGLNTSISSNTKNKVKLTPLGKVYKDTTVKYTFSETQVPQGYFPIGNSIDIFVTFDENGNVTSNKVVSQSEYFGQVTTSKTTQAANKTKPDIAIDIKNKPAFILDLRAIDKFYKKEGLADVYFEVTDSEGGVAVGNPQTDKSGYVKVTASPVYPGKTVTYYIRQLNTLTDYQPNNTVVELTVTYSEEGKIINYSISDSSALVVNEFDSSAFLNTRKIDLDIMDTPLNVKLGIFKYDETTLEAMGPVKFELTRKDMVTGATTTTEMTTQTNGNITGIIDKFNQVGGKSIKYTIHEVRTPVVDSYRIMEDIAFVIHYNDDGSIAACVEDTNDNNVMNGKPEVTTSNKLIEFDSQKVHLLQEIPNDNAFDIVIKNEDENYAGFGIEGSTFDVNVKVDSSISGTSYSPEETDENGITTVPDITKNGDITIQISQTAVGEGYRYDQDNSVTIKLRKDENIYKLDLRDDQDGILTDDNGDIDTKHAITKIIDNNGQEKTIAKIDVNEDLGKIYVTFTNLTKNELTILKQDIDSYVSLEGAKFEILAQRVDSITNDVVLDENSNPIQRIITTDENNTTDANGELYFDLGETPQNEKWIYTITEKEAPEGYPDIEAEMKFSVLYNQYGRIISLLGNSNRISPIAKNDNINCRHIIARVYNGTETPAYKVKVVTKDSSTGRYINDSDIQLDITNTQTGELIEIEPKTAGSATNGSTSKTGNISASGVKYTDIEAFGDGTPNNKGNGAIIVNKGTTYIDNIDYQGDLSIAINQTGYANGYTGGTVTQGTVKLKATYSFDDNGNAVVSFTDRDEGVFTGNVDWNEKNKTITITIYNDSRVTLHVQTLVQGVEDIVPIPDISYNVTSAISTVNRIDDTSLNVDMPASDHDEGKSQAAIGNAYAGKTIIYTLSQYKNPPIGTLYGELPEDIQIEVLYDLNGNIKRCELLSSQQYANIEYAEKNAQEQKTGGKEIYVTVRNPLSVLKYQVQVWTHDQDTITDPDGYGRLLPGVTYKVMVHQEEAVAPDMEYIEYVGTTNEDGILEVPELFNAFGYITITIVQTDVPKGYLLDTSERSVRIYRNQDGTIEPGVLADIGRELIDAKSENYKVGEPAKVILHPQIRQIEGQYTLLINKFSTATEKLITDSPAKFVVSMEKYDEDGLITYQEDIGTFTTNEFGKIQESGILFPQEAGVYKFIIVEEEAPEGYEKIKEPIEINLKITINSAGNVLIDEAWTDTENVEVQGKNQLLFIRIGNKVGDTLLENEYGLDITKVDALTGEPIEDMAIFKVWLPDSLNTAVYTETSQTLKGPGKLDYCYIEENKDYRLRLSHLIQPTEAGTYEYVFKEIVAPEGYSMIPEDLTLTIDFEYNEDGELYFASATSSNPEYLRINTETPSSIDEPFSVDILNYEAEEPETPDTNEYIIKYNANADGEDITVPTSQIKQKDIDITLDSMVPVRDGYVFKGWTTDKESTTPEYMPGDTYSINKNITLYAIWEKQEGLEISSTEYLIGIGTETAEDWNPGDLSKYEDGDLYIKGIRPQAGRDRKGKQPQNPGTSLDEFLSNITTNADTVTVYIPEIDSNGDKVLKEENIVANDSLVATGMIAKFVKGEEEVTITLIVRGDFIETGMTTGDGKLALTDYTKVSQLTRRNIDNILTTNEDKQAFDYYVDSTKAWLQNRQAIISTYTSKTLENMR